jgi:hypothetical protein
MYLGFWLKMPEKAPTAGLLFPEVLNHRRY